MTKTDTLYERIVAELPEKVTLGYVEYDDKLDVADVQACLNGDGGRNDVENRLVDLWFEDRCRHEREAIEEAISSLEDEDLDIDDLDHELLQDLREALWDRDDFDPFTDLVRHTPDLMFRCPFPTRDEGDTIDTPLQTQAVEWMSTDDEFAAENERLAEATGLPVDYIRQTMLQVGQWGSEVSLLWYGDVRKVVDAMAEQEFQDVPGHLFTFPAGSAHLLIFGRMEGSGYVADDPIPVEITIPVRLGWLELDERGAGTGWSYSDDVAGLVRGCFPADPIITPHMEET